MISRTDLVLFLLDDVLEEQAVRIEIKYANLRDIEHAAKRMADDLIRRLFAGEPIEAA